MEPVEMLTLLGRVLLGLGGVMVVVMLATLWIPEPGERHAPSTGHRHFTWPHA